MADHECLLPMWLALTTNQLPIRWRWNTFLLKAMPLIDLVHCRSPVWGLVSLVQHLLHDEQCSYSILNGNLTCIVKIILSVHCPDSWGIIGVCHLSTAMLLTWFMIKTFFHPHVYLDFFLLQTETSQKRHQGNGLSICTTPTSASLHNQGRCTLLAPGAPVLPWLNTSATHSALLIINWPWTGGSFMQMRYANSFCCWQGWHTLW